MRERITHVAQGEYAVTRGANSVLSTLLGSCVAACVRDPVARVGGMNHFLLPGEREHDASLRYGVNAMELLINGLLNLGAARARLEAKLFGGACVIQGLSSDIGARNVQFAMHFLRTERIACVGHSLGGAQGRRVLYWPHSGRAALQFFVASEAPFAEAAKPTPHADAVELFI